MKAAANTGQDRRGALQRPSCLFCGRLNSVTARIADKLANEGIAL